MSLLLVVLTATAWLCLKSVLLYQVSDKRCVELFTACNWPDLPCLDISKVCSICTNASAWTALSKAHIPLLEVLVMYQILCSCDDELVKADLKCLAVCCTSGMWCEEITQLVVAHWPILMARPGSYGLDLDSVSEFVKGCWPFLDSLNL